MKIMDQKEIGNKLLQIKDKLESIEQPLENRMYISCDAGNAFSANKFLFESLGARFVIATGIDCVSHFEIHYHYSYDQTGLVITLKTKVNDRERPSAESITPFLPAAEWIEREIHDLLGIDFKGHPNLRRLILSDDWPEGVYPLRKEKKS